VRETRARSRQWGVLDFRRPPEQNPADEVELLWLLHDRPSGAPESKGSERTLTADSPLWLSVTALVISAVALGWNVWLYLWAQRPHVKVEARCYLAKGGSLLEPSGQTWVIVGARVINKNARYPIRVHAVAFTPADAKDATMWFEQDMEVPARSAELIDIQYDSFDESNQMLGDRFTAWVELKTGHKFRSPPLKVQSDGT
jgi:hypothetical protein